MEYVRVTKDNIENEHICCAISSNRDLQVASKKDWMMKCFDEGLVFLKSTERGKCFIEYMPAENACVEDAKAKGKVGVCVLSSKKKKPFLADPKYLVYKGFRVADESDCGINLMYLPFDENTPVPQFKEIAQQPHIDEEGYVLYYTNQCPFNAKYVPILEKVAKEHNIPFQAIHVAIKEQAQLVPSPCTSYALFYNGKWLTNEQQNDKKFLKLIEYNQGIG